VFCESVETSKVDVAAIHDVKRGGFENQLIQEGDVVNLSMSDTDHARNRAPQIHLGVQFDSAFVLAKRGPWKKRQTQIDGRGIQGIGCLIELQPEIFVCIQLPGHSDQYGSKVGVDTPIPLLVGIGQCAPRNFASNPCVLKLRLHSPQACLDIAKTLSISQLSEGQAKELIETRKVSNSVFPLISPNAFVEFVPGQKTHQLRENDSS
jgi:hypothetical protein